MLVLLLLLATQTQQPDTTLYNGLKWRLAGPFRGGRSTAVTGIPKEPHSFLMGTTGGGVWKTDDAGMNWRNISDGSFGGSIGAVTVAPSDANVIYVGTGSACIRGNVSTGRGAWRSTDAGKSWQFIGLPEAGAIGDIVVHPTNPDWVYVAALGHPFGKNRERGVYRSKDGGKTWDHPLFLSDSTGVVDLAMHPTNPRILFAAAWRAERKPWTLISGGGESGIYKSVDGGDTWKKVEGLPALMGKAAITISPANPDRMWTILEAEPAGGVYRSDDGGSTWTRTNSENKLRQRAWYYNHIEADPKNENVVYALNTGFYRSVDGGKTFENINVPHGDMHDVWINPDDPRIMIVADDGGAQVSLNNGKTFSTYHNQPTAELYGIVVDNQFPYRLYGAQQDNTGISVPAWMSSNTIYPMQHWQYPAACETGPIALHPDHPEIVWGGCYGGAINRMNMRTDERRNVIAWPQLQLGQAAKDLKYRFQWVSPIVVSPHDPNTVLHGAQKVLRTRDAGMTWEEISPDLTTNTAAHLERSGGPINNDITGVEIFNTVFSLVISPQEANTIWAGTDDGRVHITRNGGGNWSEITPAQMPRYGTVNRIEASKHGAGRAFLAVQRYRLDDWKPYVFRTDDYGRSWSLISGGLPQNHPVRVVREDPETKGLLYAGTEFGIFVSLNDGQSWQSLQNNLPITPVTDIAVAHGDLAVSTQGRSFWILDDIAPLRQEPAMLFKPRDTHRVDKAGGGDLSEYWPPAAPQGVIITYHLPADGPVTVDVLDAQNRIVRSFSSDSTRADSLRTTRLPAKRGSHRFNWDMTYDAPRAPQGAVVWGYQGGVKAPPGSYTVRMAAGGRTQTQSFRLLPDPRMSAIAQADYEQQLRIGLEVRDSLNAAYSAITQLRDVRAQVNATVAKAKQLGRAEIAPLGDTLNAHLTTIEQELVQVKSQSGQDPIRFGGMLDNQYAELYGNVTGVNGYIAGGADGQPTRGALARMQELHTQWRTVNQRLLRILDTELSAFNAAVQRAGIPPVAVKPRPIT